MWVRGAPRNFYRLKYIGSLGSGAFGTVSRVASRSGKEFAIKVQSIDAMSMTDELFEREIEALVRVGEETETHMRLCLM